MDNEQVEPSAEINNIYERHLTKTVIKSVIWFLLAYVITHFYPSAKWVWYVVVTFIVIAIGFALFTKYLVYKSSKQESEDDGSA